MTIEELKESFDFHKESNTNNINAILQQLMRADSAQRAMHKVLLKLTAETHTFHGEIQAELGRIADILDGKSI